MNLDGLQGNLLLVGPDSIESGALMALAAPGAGDVVTVRRVPSLEHGLAAIEDGFLPALVMILDSMDGLLSIPALRTLKARAGACRIVYYGTMDTQFVARWLNAGIDGFIYRAGRKAETIRALNFILAGNNYVSPEILGLGNFTRPGCGFQTGCGLNLPVLTDMPVSLLVFAEDAILFTNKKWRDLSGYAEEDMIAAEPWSIIDAGMRDKFRKQVLACLAGQDYGPRLSTLVICKDGQELVLEAQIGRADVSGQPVAMVVLVDKRIDESADRGQMFLPSREDGKRTKITRRQRDVLKLLSSGAPNKIIAQNIGISESTVKVHVNRILRLLGTNNRTEAVVRAQQIGLI